MEVIMLREVSDEINKLNLLIDRSEKLRSLVPEMEKSDQIDFDIVQDDVNGKAYRCFFGLYQDAVKDAPSFNFKDISEHFGFSISDAELMFGASGSATLHERVRHLDAHIFQLEQKRGRLAA
jgi:hypothetical protein